MPFNGLLEDQKYPIYQLEELIEKQQQTIKERMTIPKEGEEENELSTRGSCSGTLRFRYQQV